jgi:hypothetical protein
MRLLDRHQVMSDNSVSNRTDVMELNVSSSTNNLPKIPRNFVDQHYWVRDSYYMTNFTTSATVEVDGAYSFTLGALNDVTDLAGVFDQYFIAAVIVRGRPLLSFAQTVVPGALCTVIDHDDAAGITLVAAREYANSMEILSNQGFTRIIEPRVAIGAYGGASFTSFANQRSWLDCASTGVQHYGLKICASATSGGTIAIELTAELIVCFRNKH